MPEPCVFVIDAIPPPALETVLHRATSFAPNLLTNAPRYTVISHALTRLLHTETNQAVSPIHRVCLGLDDTSKDHQ